MPAPEFLAITLFCRYQIIETSDPTGPWRVRGLDYWCGLHDAEREILAYHWHPFSRGGPSFPHLHLSAGAGVTQPGLQTAHLPTGIVHLEDVLRLAIATFNARPTRRAWDEVLTRSNAAGLDAWQ
jgi:hypothetical protein